MQDNITVVTTRGDRQRIPSPDSSDWIILRDPNSGDPLDLTNRDVTFALSTESSGGDRIDLTNSVEIGHATAGEVAITLEPADTAVELSGMKSLHGQFRVTGSGDDPTTTPIGSGVKVIVHGSQAEIDSTADLLSYGSLSDLEIDVDKDWSGHGITNLGSLGLGLNDAITLSSDEYHSDDAVINLHSDISNSKPWITWYDASGESIAGIVAHENSPSGDSHEHISIEAADSSGALQTRFQVPYGSDTVDIQTNNANFLVGAGYDLNIGTPLGERGTLNNYGNTFLHRNNDLGVGDKDWHTDGLHQLAKWEFYRESTDATMMIHSEAGTSQSELMFKNGERVWTIRNDATDLTLSRNPYDDIITFTEEAEMLMPGVDTAPKIGVGTDTPSGALDVNGDITLEAGDGAYKSSDGSSGWSGTFSNGDGNTVTVKDGLITDVS